jgi:hypothetical protein
VWLWALVLLLRMPFQHKFQSVFGADR